MEFSHIRSFLLQYHVTKVIGQNDWPYLSDTFFIFFYYAAFNAPYVGHKDDESQAPTCPLSSRALVICSLMCIVPSLLSRMRYGLPVTV